MLHNNLIRNEARKAKEFEQGLNQRILDCIITLQKVNFPDLVDKTTIVTLGEFKVNSHKLVTPFGQMTLSQEFGFDISN